MVLPSSAAYLLFFQSLLLPLHSPQVMPNKLKVKVEAIYKDDKEVQASQSGENLRLRVSPAYTVQIIHTQDDVS